MKGVKALSEPLAKMGIQNQLIARCLVFNPFKIRLLLSFLFGAALVFAFSPFDNWLLGLLCPAGFVLLYQNQTPKRGFLIGFLFGLGLFGCGISWIFISIATYGNTSLLISIGITCLFIVILSFFPAFQVYLALRFFKPSPWIQAFLVFPGLWTLSELLRGSLLSGFPWLLLGYTQTFSPLSGLAKCLSVFGVSWFTAFLAGNLAYIAYGIVHKMKVWRVIMCFSIMLMMMLFSGFLRQHSFTHPVGLPLRVALVQGNISQSIKWSPTALDDIIHTYTDLTQSVFSSAQLIVWPENALPTFPENSMLLLKKWDQEALLKGKALVLGLPIDDPKTQVYFNGALGLGEAKGTYLKRHLVPFGEYVPWGISTMLNFLHIPMSHFSSGPEQALPLMIDSLPVMIFICYESAYPLEVRHINQAAYLITLSDDSWFGHSLGAAQHQEIEVMRSIETGRPILRATNTGITSVIDDQSHIVKTARSFIPFVLQSSIQPVVGYTPWLIWGIIPLLIFLLMSLLPCLRLFPSKQKSK